MLEIITRDPDDARAAVGARATDGGHATNGGHTADGTRNAHNAWGGVNECPTSG
jgi:hypothetical protein